MSFLIFALAVKFHPSVLLMFSLFIFSGVYGCRVSTPATRDFYSLDEAQEEEVVVGGKQVIGVCLFLMICFFREHPVLSPPSLVISCSSLTFSLQDLILKLGRKNMSHNISRNINFSLYV